MSDIPDIEDIYRTYFKDVHTYIRRLSGDEYIAEDIASETFFKALKSIDKFRGDCDIKVWLFQIAKNCYYSFLRKRKQDNLDEYGNMSLPLTTISAEDQVVEKDESIRIIRILNGLPDMYKDVFQWRFFAELSFKEIGQIFGKSDHWACVTYHRARQMIKERMTDNNEY